MIEQQQLPLPLGPTSGTGRIGGTRNSRWQILVETGCGVANALRLRGYEVWEASREGGDLEALAALDPDVVVSADLDGAIDPTDRTERSVLHEVRFACLDAAVSEAQVDEVLGHATERVVVRSMRPRSVLRSLAGRRGSFQILVEAPGREVRVDLIAGRLGMARGHLDDHPLVGLAAIAALLGAPRTATLSIEPIEEVGQSYVDYPSLQDALLRAVLRRAPEAVRGERRAPAAMEDECTTSMHRPPDLLGMPAPDRSAMAESPSSDVPTAGPRARTDLDDPGQRHVTIALQRGRTSRRARVISTRRVKELTGASEPLPDPVVEPASHGGTTPVRWVERLWWSGWLALSAYVLLREAF